MNPLVYKFGPLEIHAFTAWLLAAVVVGSAILLGVAAYRKERLMPWLDVILGAVVVGVAGARAGHVALNQVYFAAHTDQITNLAAGGLDWHGAVAGGLIGAGLVASFRRVPAARLLDTFAIIFPLGAIAVWQACATANSAYGLEVPTLADFPTWLVIESPDVYGAVAPRLNLPPVGIGLAVLLLILMVLLTVSRRLTTLRLWLALTLYGLGMAVMAFFRAEYVPEWFGHRADQILDLATALIAVVLFAVFALARSRSANRTQNDPSPSAVVSQGA